MPIETHETAQATITCYPIHIPSIPNISQYMSNDVGTKNTLYPYPTMLALRALSQWNEYINTHDVFYLNAFLAQANQFVEHEQNICSEASVWPISGLHPDTETNKTWLSASSQGCILSVLVRTYQITNNETILKIIHRVVHTFCLDILDGGIQAPLGEEGVFFEEVATYPASYTLSGCIFALLGLYDYLTIAHDSEYEELWQSSLTTLSSILHGFDADFWTYSDLLHCRLTSPDQLALQVKLLEALASITGIEVFALTAACWSRYYYSKACHIHYSVVHAGLVLGNAFIGRLRRSFFPQNHFAFPLRVCVVVNAFPVLGGIRTVLLDMKQVTKDIWETEYLTRHIGPNTDGHVIHQFGSEVMSPWHFHTVWFYVLDGCRSLFKLMRQGARYDVVFPQDGVYTAALAGLVAKLTGVRVVCIDHAYLTMLNNPSYQAERLGELTKKKWPLRLVGHLLFALYWPSMYFLAWLAARFVDHYFIPGIAGDGIETSCKKLNVPTYRITRFASMINLERHVLLDTTTKNTLRKEKGLAEDSIIIAIICRLALEKGLDVAIEGLAQALFTLPPFQRQKVRVVIAGEGPIRSQVEAWIQQRELDLYCLMWGNISSEEVLSLLAISDIFLNTTIRGTCFPMSILEAMAAGCAVIASTQPISNKKLLSEGRGIVVTEHDSVQTGEALIKLINDADLRRQLGVAARNYIASQHNPKVFRRALQRVTQWSALDTLLTNDAVVVAEKGTRIHHDNLR